MRPPSDLAWDGHWKALIRITVLLSALALAGCATATATATPGRTPTVRAATALPAPTPQLELVAVQLISGPSPGLVTVLGWVQNRSDTAVDELRLNVELVEPDGNVLAGIVIVPVQRGLEPGQRTPFAAEFEGVTGVAMAQVEPVSQAVQAIQLAELSIDMGEQFVMPDGRLAILGTLTNDEAELVALNQLGLLAVDTRSQPRLLAGMQAGPAYLAPGETAPFLASADHNPGQARWEAYYDARVAESSTAATIESVPDLDLRFTPQGAPFVLGELTNSAAEPQRIRMQVALMDGQRLLSLGELETPVALEPGTRLGYTLAAFPAYALRLGKTPPEQLSVVGRLESIPEPAHQLPLRVSVDAFHSVGSTLFVRGSLTNEQVAALARPAVLAEVRLVTGELWTAGWTVLSAPVEPGASAEFVLELPLAEELEPTELEFDLRAFGVVPGN